MDTLQKDRAYATDLPKEMQAHHYPILYQVEETHWWYVGRRRIIRFLVERILPTLDNPKPKILDVGCGTGANLKMLANYGRAEGVDISPQAVDFCSERGLDSVKLGAIEELPYEDGSFELVTALDVVEHLDDDVAGLREMRRVLRPDGRLLLFVPAFMFLWGVQDDVSNHRRRYTLPGFAEGRRSGRVFHRVGQLRKHQLFSARAPRAFGDAVAEFARRHGIWNQPFADEWSI